MNYITIKNKKIVRYGDVVGDMEVPLMDDEAAIVEISDLEYAIVMACHANFEDAIKAINRLNTILAVAEILINHKKDEL